MPGQRVGLAAEFSYPKCVLRDFVTRCAELRRNAGLEAISVWLMSQ